MKTWILSSLGCGNYLREESIQGRKLFAVCSFCPTFAKAGYTFRIFKLWLVKVNTRNLQQTRDYKHIWLSKSRFQVRILCYVSFYHNSLYNYYYSNIFFAFVSSSLNGVSFYGAYVKQWGWQSIYKDCIVLLPTVLYCLTWPQWWSF